MRIEYCEPEGYYQLGQGQYANTTAAAVLMRFKVAMGTQYEMEFARHAPPTHTGAK